MELDYKIEFARREMLQEQAAFAAKEAWKMSVEDATPAQPAKKPVYTSKDQLVEKLKTQLNDDKQCIKALFRIFSYQTFDEQSDGTTKEYNKEGFTGVDAEILTSLHDFYVERGYLTKKQMEILHKKMPKYARQLVNHSIETGKIKKVDGKYTW